MKGIRAGALTLLAFVLFGPAALGQEIRSIPVVTQVQGAVFYRTSITLSGGVFGNDGSTRANLGIVNEGFGSTDVRVTYYNGDTGGQLKQFFLSSVVHHDLEENEVVQLNNIFNDSAIPGTVHTLVVKVEAVTADVYVSAYVVQLDNTTNDGSFFFLEEE